MCLCCGQRLALARAFDGWCDECAGAVLSDVLGLRDGRPAVVGVRVCLPRDWGADAIARAVVGPIPFHPSAAELERLTYE